MLTPYRPAGFLDYMEEIDSQEMDTRFDNKRDAFLEKQRKLHAGRALLFYTCVPPAPL